MTERITAAEFLASLGAAPAPPAIMTPAKLASARNGRKAQRQGKQFEAELDGVHHWARADILADIERLPVPTVCVGNFGANRNKGQPYRRLAERQRADYAGKLGPAFAALVGRPEYTGKAIDMEAKSCKKRMLALPIITGLERSRTGKPADKRFGLKLHQYEALVRAEKFGGIGVVVWRNGPDVLIWRAKERESRIGDAVPASEFTAVDTRYQRHWLGALAELIRKAHT